MAGHRIPSLSGIAEIRSASIRARRQSIAQQRVHVGRDDSVPLAQATALYQAGSSTAAQRILDTIPNDFADDLVALEALALMLAVDADLGTNRASVCRARWARYLARQTEQDGVTADAGFAWIDASTATDRRKLDAALDRVAKALRARSRADARACALLARFSADLVPSLVELGDYRAAITAVDDAAALVAVRDDVPAAVRALIHVNRAFVFATSSETLRRSASEREAASKMSLLHGLPRVYWKCLYLREYDSIWRGDQAAALRDAQMLSASVAASESCSWRRIARSQLSNAYTAAGDFVAAQLMITEMARGYEEDAALHSCKLAYLQGHDVDAIARARELVSFAHIPASVLANALLYSAAAAYRLGDRNRAATDIENGVALFESSSMPALFMAQRIYALAYRITARKRFRDVVLEIQSAFEQAHREAPKKAETSVLTARQREIAELAASGETNVKIARSLGISPRTVGNHLAIAFDVLEIHARWQLPEALGYRRKSAVTCPSR